MTDDLTATPGTDVKLPNPTDPLAVRWGLWEVAMGLVVFVTLLAGASVLAVSAPLRGVTASNVELVGFVSALVAYAGLATVIVLASRRSGLRSLAADFGLRFRPVDVAIGIGIGIAGRLFTVLLSVVAIALTGYAPTRGNFELAVEPLWIVLNGIVIAVIVAPVVEELFFRGMLLRAVRNRVLRRRGTEAAAQRRAVILAIVVSALAFMALHLYQSSDWTLFIILAGSTLFVGVLNALVAVRTGRLGGAIVGHVVFNGTAVALSLLTAQAPPCAC